MYILIKVKYANAFPLPPYQIKSASLFSEDLGGDFIPDTNDINNSYEGGIESDMDTVRRCSGYTLLSRKFSGNAWKVFAHGSLCKALNHPLKS